MPPEQADARAQAAADLQAVSDAVQVVVRGKPAVVELALVALLCGGHVLLEDIPGVGKTTLASALAAATGGRFRRIQFTSDLLPGDITGVNILADGDFRFRPGPLFANLVLADEINRATPKAQSALLEAMAERRVTVDGVSHPLPALFVVLATQNPHDLHGTFPLPDSQLDRFLIRLSMGYPDRDSEREILRRGHRPTAQQAITPAALLQAAALIDTIAVHEEVEDYLLDLIARTREDARLLRGASTRGAEALYRASRGLALIRGRDFVIPEDIQELAVPVLAHRVRPRSAGVRSSAAARQAIQELVWDLPAPL